MEPERKRDDANGPASTFPVEALTRPGLPSIGKRSLETIPHAGNSAWLVYVLAGLVVLLFPIFTGADDDAGKTALRLMCALLFFLCGSLSRQLGRLESHVREVAALVDGLAAREYGPDYYAQRNAVTWLIELLDRFSDGSRTAIADSLRTVTGQDFGEDSDAWRSWWESARSTFRRDDPSDRPEDDSQSGPSAP